MALLHLAAEYARQTTREMIAFTVDHGLRQSSAEEGRQVAEWCSALGVQHKILLWVGNKPTTGVQAAAREARYRLLCNHAVSEGAGAILTGHTSDDQVETVFMRLARGAGPQGLAAMARVSTIASGAGVPIQLIRPLIDVTRASLEGVLQQCRQAFISDPSNDDPTFERVRTRALLAALEEQSLLTRKALQLTAKRAREASELLKENRDALFRSSGGVFHHWGGVEICPSILRERHGERVLQHIIFAVSGSESLPNSDSVKDVMMRLEQVKKASLGGALLEKYHQRLWIYREPSALTGRAGVPARSPEPVLSGQSILWDRRFVFRNETRETLTVAPVGYGQANALFSGPPEALASCPAICRDGKNFTPMLMPERHLQVKSLAAERFFGAVHRF